MNNHKFDMSFSEALSAHAQEMSVIGDVPVSEEDIRRNLNGVTDFLVKLFECSRLIATDSKFEDLQQKNILEILNQKKENYYDEK
ncbi:hypothetical protein IKU74_04410 [bacterium]|nr:hypothetical protein [bacterium]